MKKIDLVLARNYLQTSTGKHRLLQFRGMRFARLTGDRITGARCNGMRVDRPVAANHDTLVQQYFRSTLPYWEEIYTERTVYSRIYQERARQAIGYVDSLGLPLRAPVLEIGCGPGFITTAMAREGFNVSAIDSAPEMLERTRARARQAGLEPLVLARFGNISSIPFADAAFEIVVVVGVSEWLDSIRQPLVEIYRVLRPGGHLIISADNYWSLHQVLDPVFNPALRPIKSCIGKALRFTGLRTPQARVRAYSIREFDKELSDSGFDKIASRAFGFGPFTFCNKTLLNEEAGWELHRTLQRLADQGIPLLRSAGLVYMVLSQKRVHAR
jgi:SAM-dependent methyltransferase